MDKSTKMKSEVLAMLEQFMMGETGKKIKPGAISVEMVVPKKESKEGLKDVLDEASKNEYGREPMTEDEGDIDGDGDHDIHDHALEKEAEMYEDAKEGEMEDEDEDEEEKYCSGGMAKKKSLREFFDR